MALIDVAFMRVRLSGGRFRKAELPFFMLEDLAPLQNMIVDVAKWRFREKHDRRRTTSTFNQTYLKIVGLCGGSSVIEIDIDTTQQILEGVPIPNNEYFKAAAKDIVEVIKVAEQGSENLNNHIPAQCMAYFDRMGRSLRSDEIMEVIAGQHTANLTQRSREVLVTHSSFELLRDIIIRGAVSKVDQKNMKFKLEPVHGLVAECSFLEQHRETVLKALVSYNKDRRKVQVQGTAKYDKNDRLQSIESVKSVVLLDILDVSARLDEFRNMHDGWLEDEGVAPDPAGLDWLSHAFELYYPDTLPLPRTYPTADGGVSMEWRFGSWDIDMEVDINSHIGEWHVFNRDDKSGDEKRVELDNSDGWKWVCEQLTRFEKE